MNNQTPVPEQNNLAVPKKLDFFKIVVVILGILIVLGLFGNIYILLRKEKQNPPVAQFIPTPIPTQTSPTPTLAIETSMCKNEVLHLSVQLPNNKWNCKSSIREGDKETGRFGLMEVSSDIFNISIASYMDTGIACYGDEGPGVKCEVVSFFSNDLLNLSVLKHNSQEISFLGLFKDKIRAIKIDPKVNRPLNSEEKTELIQFLSSIRE